MRMLVQLRVVGVASVLWLAATGCSKSPSTVDSSATVDEVLKFATTKLTGYKDWSANFLWRIQAKGAGSYQGGGNHKGEGTIAFKSPNLWRNELTVDRPGKGASRNVLTVVGADQILWLETTVKGQKSVYKLELSRDPRTTLPFIPFDNATPMDQLVRINEIHDLRVKEGVEHERQAMYLLEGGNKPPSAFVQFRDGRDVTGENPLWGVLSFGVRQLNLRVFVGKQDGFVHMIEAFNKEGDRLYVQEYTNLKFDRNQPDELFSYTPPAGTQLKGWPELRAGQ